MKKKRKRNISFLVFDNLDDIGLCHFSTLRYDGISEGNYASLNLGNLSDDNPAHVMKNRKVLADAFNIKSEYLFIPHQTHSDHILVIDKQFLSLSEDEKQQKLKDIDALITAEKNTGIGITTADCVPVLLYDEEKQILAAIHAGWKGTVARISQRVINIMVEKYGSHPQNILAGIGPSISPEYFEVGEEVGYAFEKAGFSLPEISYRNKQTNKLHINLWEANRYLLIEMGIKNEHIEVAELCTYSDADNFFSARRQTIHSGRMLTGGILIDL